MISRHEASVGQAPVERREAERERNLMRPDGERVREREGEGRRSEKCTRPNRAGYRCISDDAFQEFRARSTLEEFFFPLLVSPPLLLRRRPAPPPPRSLARSLARPRIQNNVPTLHRRVLLLRHSSTANRRDQLAIILFAAEILPASGET